MTRDEIQIVHEAGQFSRVLAINFKAVIEARDEAVKERDVTRIVSESWKARAIAAEDALREIRAMIAVTKK